MANHYYDQEGNPRHGEKLKIVREEGLLVSVTTYLSLLDKPAIHTWKEKGLLKVAHNIMQKARLSLDDLTKASYDKFEEENNAAAIGTACHNILEALIKERPTEFGAKEFYMAYADDLAKPMYESVMMAYNWLISTAVQSGVIEEIVVNKEDRYAGQVDFFGLIKDPYGNSLPGLIDWKTQGIKHPGYSKRDPSKMLKPKVNKYETWALQLGAYAKPTRAQHGYIGVISSNPDFPYFQAVHYSGETLIENYKVFRKIAEVYRFLKNL